MNLKEEKDFLISQIEVYKAILKSPHATDKYKAAISTKLQSFEARYVLITTPRNYMVDSAPHYKEVWIDGELFLECTSCSADGPGNCGCWLTD